MGNWFSPQPQQRVLVLPTNQSYTRYMAEAARPASRQKTASRRSVTPKIPTIDYGGYVIPTRPSESWYDSPGGWR